MHRRALMTGMIAAGLIRPGSVAAQDECPAGFVCVPYDGVTIAIDPADGPYQVIVVEEQSITATTLSGTEQRSKIVGAGFLLKGETYVFDQLFEKERTGVFADAELEDVYVLGPSDGN
jgi:hypothetical protein